MTTTHNQATTLELSTIQPIAAHERHGRARDLFTIWFGSNIMLLTVVTGALAVTVFKLPFFAAVLALVLGNLVGGVFMALHSAQARSWACRRWFRPAASLAPSDPCWWSPWW